MLRVRLDMDFEPTKILTTTGLDWYAISKLNQDGKKYKKKTNLCKLAVILSYLQFLGLQPVGLAKYNRPSSIHKIARDTRMSRVKCLV